MRKTRNALLGILTMMSGDLRVDYAKRRFGYPYVGSYYGSYYAPRYYYDYRSPYYW